MEATVKKKTGGMGPGKRFGMGFGAWTSVIFAALLAGMVNYISHKHNVRVDISRAPLLSEGTKRLLGNLDVDVDIFLIAGQGHDLHSDTLRLFRELDYASERINVESIDPNRDLARTGEVALKYGVGRSDCVLIASGERRKIVSLDELADHDASSVDRELSGQVTEFRGEQVICSAIRNLVAVRDPVVYFLAGHGEACINNYDRYFGYSLIARSLQRKNVETRRLVLGEDRGIPEDCDALVIAGPARPMALVELDIIRSYLERAGRVLLMLDSGVNTGLEKLLAEWGVRLADDRVVGPTLTGRDLVVSAYGEHPVTRELHNVRTIFNLPRSIEPLVRAEPNNLRSADRPVITVLAASTEEGWADMPPSRNPPAFDPEFDRPGPIPVAVAVERGLLPGMDMELNPTRMVIVGDSTFVSNGSLLSGYAPDFFLAALNWLVEREAPLDIASRRVEDMRVLMTLSQVRSACLIVAVALPGAALLMSMMAWALRRR